MKYLNLLLLFFGCLLSSTLFAQTPKKIEDDLLKSFKKIDYWYQKENDPTSHIAATSDSLFRANDVFARKLENYARKFPFTLIYPFNSLKKNMDISTSSDGLFRIYSWDAETGGTEHYFENVMQFKKGATVNAIIDKPDGEAISNYNYNKIYTLKVNNKAYYLARYLMIGSTKDVSEGIHIFTIENGEITDAKLIKTHSGLHSDLSYDYDLSRTSEKVKSDIHFNTNTMSIYIPVALENGRLTNNYIVYKFTGQYFERVKN